MNFKTWHQQAARAYAHTPYTHCFWEFRCCCLSIFLHRVMLRNLSGSSEQLQVRQTISHWLPKCCTEQRLNSTTWAGLRWSTVMFPTTLTETISWLNQEVSGHSRERRPAQKVNVVFPVKLMTGSAPKLFNAPSLHEVVFVECCWQSAVNGF